MADSLSRDDKDFFIQILENKFKRVEELIEDVKDIKILVQEHEHILRGVTDNNGLVKTVKQNSESIVELELKAKDLITESTFNNFKEKQFSPLEKWKENISGIWGILMAVIIGVFIFIANYVVGRILK
jgi:hypothetical protein